MEAAKYYRSYSHSQVCITQGRLQNTNPFIPMQSSVTYQFNVSFTLSNTRHVLTISQTQNAIFQSYFSQRTAGTIKHNQSIIYQFSHSHLSFQFHLYLSRISLSQPNFYPVLLQFSHISDTFFENRQQPHFVLNVRQSH